MKVVIFACTLAAAAVIAAGAPAATNGAEERVMFVPQPQQYRSRRSHFAPSYGAPCAGPVLPAIAPAPAYLAPIHGSIGYGGGGYGGGGHGYGGYGPHYRAEDGETEILNFSDMEQGMSEHVPMARYGGYGAAPVIHGGAGIAGLGLGGAVATGPAYGVFPHANTGGCNVPLLLSCSPSIVPGRLVKSYGGYGAAVPAVGVAATNAYRGADDQNLEHEENPEEPHENLEPAEDNTHSS
ncbi:unnamed protein product [Chilo suppressalis]|uniref:Uncharacterized protein n=1 Tax=Chilo suppressalis TaxID=168631 RepID=A0ABN8BF58_CHISP|nr:unnamed protein product [Chilo suppressalis]